MEGLYHRLLILREAEVASATTFLKRRIAFAGEFGRAHAVGINNRRLKDGSLVKETSTGNSLNCREYQSEISSIQENRTLKLHQGIAPESEILQECCVLA